MRSASSPVLTLLGGAGTVTGSRFLVQSDGGRLLVDCGLYQGLKALRERNWQPLGVPPDSIGAVVLTHAHLDHCGYLPALVRDGFAGPALTSVYSADLVPIVLRDSAHLQEEQAEHALRGGYSRHDPPRPLYTEDDAERAIEQLRTLPYGLPEPVAGDVTVTLRPAGHILGSASAVVRLQRSGRTVLVSGDLGRPTHPLLMPPAPPPEADVVLIESTYGDRRHDERALERFADAVRRTVERGGSVLVPAFAVDRTEVLLFHLRRMMAEGTVPQVPVFVDSPMALAALRVYRRALASADPELRPGLTAAGDPFDTGDLREVTTAAGSEQLNAPPWPCVIISASGMATGGRVLHHLAQMLPEPRHTVVLVGFQAAGTRGRSLQEGQRVLKMLGRYVPVRADVVDIPAFSVHADEDELVGWLARAPRPPDLCLVVHGEPDAAAALRDRVDRELGWSVVVPRLGERVRLD